jgi:hypothetical protein
VWAERNKEQSSLTSVGIEQGSPGRTVKNRREKSTPAASESRSDPTKPKNPARTRDGPKRTRSQSSTEEQVLQPPKRRKSNDSSTDIPQNRLVVRARGFENLYSQSFPLIILKRLIERHRFSSSIVGLDYPSDLIRRTAMRGLLKLSSPQYVENLGGSQGRGPG